MRDTLIPILLTKLARIYTLRGLGHCHYAPSPLGILPRLVPHNVAVGRAVRLASRIAVAHLRPMRVALYLSK